MSLGVSSMLQEVGSQATVDYAAIDCNSVATRRYLLQRYNTQLGGSYHKAVDVLEQKPVKAKADLFECYGPYVFSDGSTKKILYRETANSLGDKVITFIPDSW